MAEFRAEENDATDPLYRDPVVHLFLNEKIQQAAEHIATGFPLMKEMVKIRTRYLTICWTVGSLQAAAIPFYKILKKLRRLWFDEGESASPRLQE